MLILYLWVKKRVILHCSTAPFVWVKLMCILPPPLPCDRLQTCPGYTGVQLFSSPLKTHTVTQIDFCLLISKMKHQKHFLYNKCTWMYHQLNLNPSNLWLQWATRSTWRQFDFISSLRLKVYWLSCGWLVLFKWVFQESSHSDYIQISEKGHYKNINLPVWKLVLIQTQTHKCAHC